MTAMTEQVVKTWMSGDPVSLRADASALEALDLMVERGIRHLPVVDDARRVVGVVTIDDLRAALPVTVSLRKPPSAEERPLLQDWQVGEVMTHAPFVAEADTTLADAAESMAEHRIGCLPVVDEEGRLAGLLSETDALHALATALRGAVRERPQGKGAELDELVAELRSERERITGRLDRLHAEEREITTREQEEPLDEGDRSADLRDVRTAETLDEAAIRRLRALDRALDHAAQGRLSICDRCGGHIPVTRLRALPGTTVCVRCAQLAEPS